MAYSEVQCCSVEMYSRVQWGTVESVKCTVRCKQSTIDVGQFSTTLGKSVDFELSCEGKHMEECAMSYAFTG